MWRWLVGKYKLQGDSSKTGWPLHTCCGRRQLLAWRPSVSSLSFAALSPTLTFANLSIGNYFWLAWSTSSLSPAFCFQHWGHSQNPQRFIIPTHPIKSPMFLIPAVSKSIQTQLKTLQTQSKALLTRLKSLSKIKWKSLQVEIMIVWILKLSPNIIICSSI